MNVKGSHRISRVLAILAALAVLVIIASPGTTFPAAPTAPTLIESPAVADSNGEVTAIVDHESRRILFLDAHDEVTGVFRCATLDSSIDAVTDVCVRGETVYVAGVTFLPDSDIVDVERVIIYDRAGKELATVYEGAPSKYGDRRIVTLSTTDDGVVATVRDEHLIETGIGAASPSLTFLLLGEQGNQEVGKADFENVRIYDADYISEGNFVTISYRGIVNDTHFDAPSAFPGRVFTAIVALDESTYYACDDVSGALCRINVAGDVEELLPGTTYDNVHVNGETLSLCDIELNTVKLCDLEGKVRSELSAVAPSLIFMLRMTAVWAAVIYLVVLLVVLGVRKGVQLAAAGQTEGFGPMLASLAVVLAVGVAVGQSSYASYQESLDLRAQEIGMCADYVSMNMLSLIEPVKEACHRDILRTTGEELERGIEAYTAATTLPSTLVDASYDNGIGLYYMLYGKDERGVFYVAGSEAEDVVGTSLFASANKSAVEAAFEGIPQYDAVLYRGETTYDRAIFRIVQIPDGEGGVAGVVEVGSKLHSFEASVSKVLASRILALLVMMLVVYLSYAELRGCSNSLFEYRELRRKSTNDALASLTRPFAFCVTLLISIDGVMTVLIANDLLKSAGMYDTGVLVALPSIMLGVGLVLGQVLYGWLAPRTDFRKLVIGWTLAMVVFALGAVVAVRSGSIWAYSAAKLALSIPFGLLYTMAYSLPRAADSDSVRLRATDGVRRTDTSAAALGLILGGYAAQTLGNAWVYVIVAIACLPMLAMSFNLLPKGFGAIEEAQHEHLSSELKHVVRGGRSLTIDILIILPTLLAAGYASFLFPLISTNAGFEKVDINNIVVLGQLVVYVGITSIDRLYARFGNWHTAAAAVVLMGLVFLLFSANTTTVWAVTVIAVIAVLCKTADGWKGAWMQRAREAGLPLGMATGFMLAVRSAILALQPFILVVMLDVAGANAVILLGALCLACAISFFLITRKRPN